MKYLAALIFILMPSSVLAQHNVHLVCTPGSSPVGVTVAGYNFYRSAAPGGPYTQLNSMWQPYCTYDDATVQGGRRYYYVATAVSNTAKESAYSNEIATLIPVAAPTGLTGTVAKLEDENDDVHVANASTE